jgi:hypothetical protein
LITGEELPYALRASEGASLNAYSTWGYRFRKASEKLQIVSIARSGIQAYT